MHYKFSVLVKTHKFSRFLILKVAEQDDSPETPASTEATAAPLFAATTEPEAFLGQQIFRDIPSVTSKGCLYFLYYL